MLRSLVASGMLIEVEDDVFSFRHALARETIEADLLGREKRRLHEQALEAVRQAAGDDDAAIAHHALRRRPVRRDGRGGAPGRGAATSAADRPIRHCSSRNSASSEAPDDLVLLGTAARAAWLAGLSEDAVAHAERLLTVARHRGLARPSRAALRRLVRLQWELGDRGRDGACTESLIELVDVLPRGEELGHAMACIAQSAMLRDIPDQAIEWADRGDRTGGRARPALGSGLGSSARRVLRC